MSKGCDAIRSMLVQMPALLVVFNEWYFLMVQKGAPKTKTPPFARL